MPAAARTQKKRDLAIDTPLGADKLLLLSMAGSESLGRLFHFTLELLSEKEIVKSADILGKNVTIRLETVNGNTRYFNGFISGFMLLAVDKTDPQNKLFSYRATMVPWLWFLTRHANCRIFQEMTVPKIIEQVFRDRHFTDFKIDLSGTYRKWEYCVQYRETDFNFVSRLMENEGIYYYFKHESGKHTLMVCDSPQNHSPAEKYDSLHYDLPDLKHDNDDFVWNWSHGEEITPNAYSITDYDPLQPTAHMENPISVDHSHDPEPYEIFDYPGGFVDPGEGKTYSNTRMEELEAQYSIARGTTSARGVFAGCTFKLEEHPAYDDPTEFLITAATFQMSNDDMATGKGGVGPQYICQITCIPKVYEFRARRVTPKPIVQGPQTAIVVTMDGQEITTDKYGRVKVKFHWDRTECMNDKASCWIRVSQPSAGKGWGGFGLPRKGQEVIVDFLDGDPDRPIITGRVYNGDNLPAQELPKFATMTGVKTNSCKGGGGFNEFRIEDSKDHEQIFMHAQKNYDFRVKNDRFETVERHMHVTVDSNYFLNVKANYHVQVGADYYLNCDGDHHASFAKNHYTDITADCCVKITGNYGTDVNSNSAHHVGGKYSLKVDGDLVIESTSSITLVVGSSSISIGPDGIKVDTSGTVDVASGGVTTHKSASYEIKCLEKFVLSAVAQLTLNSAGIVEAVGSMIKLN